MNKIFACITTSMLLTACGSDSTPSNTPEPQPPLPAYISGTVTHVSSPNNLITVNGYSVSIAKADISYANTPLSAEVIQVGMRVKIDTEDQSVEKVALDPNLLGEISAVDQGTITVNGIALPLTTTPTENYKIGDWVAINGYPTAADQWQVESINLIPNFAFAEIEGRVSGLNTTLQQFHIGTAVIDYANAHLEGNLQEGAWVEVEGQSTGAYFLAAEVDVEDAPSFNDMELEGTITWVSQDKTQFELNARIRLYVTAKTQYEEGDQTHLTEGKAVEVDIRSTPQGLWAEEVDFEASHSGGTPVLNHKFDLEGRATLNANNQLEINGFIFSIDAKTRFDDGLTLATLEQKWIQIEGVEIADKLWLVKEIDAEDPSNELDLSGLVVNQSMWGYPTSDASLAAFEGKWAAVECQFDGHNIHSCRIDD